ncbi:MAG: Clp protease N-terminal domain-containing protein [Oscillospiraceae bacterium]
MNADKFTQKTIETIQTAQSMEQENGNQSLTPEHLLYALVDADGGLIGTLLGRMGVDCNAVLSELDTAINQLPKVSGGSGRCTPRRKRARSSTSPSARPSPAATPTSPSST